MDILNFIVKLLLILANAFAVVWYWLYVFSAIVKRDRKKVSSSVLPILCVLLLDLIFSLGVFL